MNFGIDAISFYTANYYLDLKILAAQRNIDLAKFNEGLGQFKMAITPPDEDVVTLAANAANKILVGEDLSAIELVLFATETGIDNSKAAAIYLHKLLNLPARCRCIELKQACYAGTAGLQLALAMLQQKPQTKVLLVASDIAHYALNSPAESSQGAGAVAMLLSANPRILNIEPESGFATKEAMDFWRPINFDVPLLDGKLSCEIYMRMAEETWQQYSKLSGRKFSDHAHFCYHVPVPKLAEKTHKRLARANGFDLNANEIERQMGTSLIYSREVGNCYTAALYLSIISLLENTTDDLTDKRLGMYSYGSGAAAEFFSGIVAKNYRDKLLDNYHQNLLRQREALSYEKYLDFYNYKLPQGDSKFAIMQHKTGQFRLAAIDHNQRIYEKVT